jgi:hypothetical protein
MELKLQKTSSSPQHQQWASGLTRSNIYSTKSHKYSSSILTACRMPHQLLKTVHLCLAKWIQLRVINTRLWRVQRRKRIRVGRIVLNRLICKLAGCGNSMRNPSRLGIYSWYCAREDLKRPLLSLSIQRKDTFLGIYRGTRINWPVKTSIYSIIARYVQKSFKNQMIFTQRSFLVNALFTLLPIFIRLRR